MEITLIIIRWILFAAAASTAAAARGRSPHRWFWLGLLLGPFALILVLVAQPLE